LSRSNRLAKYNQLLRIEQLLGKTGTSALHCSSLAFPASAFVEKFRRQIKKFIPSGFLKNEIQQNAIHIAFNN
jgi:hypothetical protein